MGMKKKAIMALQALVVVFVCAFLVHAGVRTQSLAGAASPPFLRTGLQTLQYSETMVCTKAEPAAVPAAAEGKKLIALTFDDGPNEKHTRQVLDILEKEDVRATFFVIGVHIKANPAILRQTAQAGHQIGSHCWGHKDLTKLTPSALEKELADTSALIADITGQAPTCLRPPLGAQNSAVLQAVTRANMRMVLWCVDPADWRGPPAAATATHIINAAKDGDIVLMHDTQGNTVTALRTIIPALRAKGFYFVTVDEMLALRPTEEQAIRFLRG